MGFEIQPRNQEPSLTFLNPAALETETRLWYG
jgi:hypothetical protein